MPGLYGRDLGYRISSPPVLHHPPQGQHSQTLTFAVNNSSTDAASSPSLKRKHPSNLVEGVKRRRDTVTDDDDGFDGGQGAKHWTDEEKTRLFQWLMGPDEDEHWNSLRAAKNSCLRTVRWLPSSSRTTTDSDTSVHLISSKIRRRIRH